MIYLDSIRIDKSIFTTPLPCVFNIIMGGKDTEKIRKKEKIVEKRERQMTLLEKLWFAQMMFDFYMAPVE